MDGIKISVHPLFFLFGIYYALTGRIFIFLSYTCCAIIHEIGHSIEAYRQGVKLNKICLMPFGAVVNGNIKGLKFLDQIKIAIAGPLINIAVAIIFVACWWVFPITYAYTDIAVEACLTLAIINLIPVYPLDGGRIISALLCLKHGEKKGEKLSTIIGVVFALILFAFFILSIFVKFNLSLLFFSCFVLFSAIDKRRKGKYLRRLYFDNEILENGKPYKKIAVSEKITVKKLVGLLDEKSVNEVVVFRKNGKKIILEQEKLQKIIEENGFYQRLCEIL